MRDAKRLLYSFVIIAIGGALWITAQAAVAMYHYYALSARTLPENITWQAVARDSEHYHYLGNYTYSVNGILEHGATTLPSPAYRNAWGAERGLPEIQHEQWYVYYDPVRPSLSSLYRSFPLKETLYSAIMWGLVLYFIGFVFYVQRR